MSGGDLEQPSNANVILSHVMCPVPVCSFFVIPGPPSVPPSVGAFEPSYCLRVLLVTRGT